VGGIKKGLRYPVGLEYTVMLDNWVDYHIWFFFLFVAVEDGFFGIVSILDHYSFNAKSNTRALSIRLYVYTLPIIVRALILFVESLVRRV
jgi:hypothetical protein